MLDSSASQKWLLTNVLVLVLVTLSVRNKPPFPVPWIKPGWTGVSCSRETHQEAQFQRQYSHEATKAYAKLIPPRSETAGR